MKKKKNIEKVKGQKTDEAFDQAMGGSILCLIVTLCWFYLLPPNELSGTKQTRRKASWFLGTFFETQLLKPQRPQ